MRIRALTIPAALLSVSAVACSPEAAVPPAMPVMEASSATVVAPSYAQGPGLDRSAIDESTSACTDFYQHACGAWLKNTPIPDDKAGWTRSFSVIDEKNKELLKAILTDLSAGKTGGVAFGKEMASVYGACMDESAIEKRGAKPLAPGFSWKTYLKTMKVSDAVAINVSMVAYMMALPERFDKEPLPLVKSYLEARILSSTATQLSKPFDDAAFAYKAALTGQKTREIRWKRCVGLVNDGMGEALAQPFVAKTLGDGGKDAVQKLIMAIEASMEARLPTLAWMDDETRAKAFEKVRAIVNKVVHPSKWRSYEGLAVKAGDHFGNVLAAEAFENARQMTKVGKPVDREEWFMSPPDVNAYYDAQTNQMVFPAGILQPPFYGPQNAKSANFGAIGMVMGHELTHGFDDEGRQFDAKGNLTDWWTPACSKGFDERAECVVAQYNDFVPIDDLHVNGKLTLGENLADLGGINLAYQAMMSDAEASKTGSAGFTPQQTFFYAYAQSWCTNQRPEMQRLRVKTDPHSPPKFRVNGPLTNMPAFREAFACKAGDAMIRENACRVW